MNDTSNNEPNLEIPSGVGRCAVTCPMCGFKHTQYRLNPRMYWNNGMDMDRKPSSYQCLKGLAGLYPPLYELWQCPQCHFTAHNRIFPDPLKEVFIEKSLVQRQLAERQTSAHSFGRICQKLAITPDFHDINFRTAIQTVLLEIHFAQFFVGLIRQGYSNIAKAYLRLAWLHRDWKQMEPETHDAEQARLNDLLETVKPDWETIPMTEKAALELACEYYETAITENAIEGDPRELAGILQHLARIYIQIGDRVQARSHLDRARRIALDEFNRLEAIRHEDNRRSHLSPDERSRLVSDSRRLQVISDESTDLMAMLKSESKPKTPPPQAPPQTPPAGKKSLLRGLFGNN